MDLFGIDAAINSVVVILLVWIIWVPVGGYVAVQKRRSVIEGIVLGCLGPIGVLIAALLPTKLPKSL